MVCLSSPQLWAQDFVHLSPARYPVGTLFTTQLRNAADAVVEYPEYEPLTRAEVKQLHKLGLEIGAEPIVHTEVGIARKQRLLDVSFLPIIKRAGRYYRLTSVRVSPKMRPGVAKATAPKLQAPAGNRYASHSVLASGMWKKIRVASEGVYALTESTLRGWGFSNPANVKLFGYGGRIVPEAFTFSGHEALVDDLEEVPLRRTSDGRLLFFAEGTVRLTWSASLSKWVHEQNPYSAYSYYFLTEGDAPMELTEISHTAAAGQQVLDSVTACAILDNDRFSWYQGGREFFDNYDFASGNSHSFSIAAPGITASGRAIVDIAFGASHSSRTTTASMRLNGTQLGTMTVQSYGEYEAARERVSTFTTSSATEANSLAITTTSGIPARLDFVRMSYQRQLRADGAPFVIAPNQAGAATLRLQGATAATELWQIGISGDPLRRVSTTLQTGGELLASVPDATRRFVVVDLNADYPAPELVGDVANQDLHAHEAAHMIIITPTSGKFDAQAERLAQYHRERDAMNVRIVHAMDLYNEFSSGTPDASAYRRYLKMLYDRANTEDEMPKYLVLFGPSVWDNRGVTLGNSFNADDYLLCYERNNSWGETNVSIGAIQTYVTDDYFAMLDDGEGANIAREKPDVAVGRIVCTSLDEAKTIVDKTLSYSDNENTGSWKNTLVFIGDEGDNNLHMNGAEQVAKSSDAVTNNRMIVKRVYPDAYTRTTGATGNSYPEVTALLREQMARGALMFNYTGHGSETRISHSYVLTLSDFAQTSSAALPVWVFASCEITPFDQPIDDLGRQALYNKHGGAVALLCSSRAVYSSYNTALNDAFCKYALDTSGGQPQTLGEALRLSKCDMVGTSVNGPDVTMNKLKYALLGDPALRLRLPTHNVVLDSINGTELKQGDMVQLKAGQHVRMSGYIENLPDFEGTVSLTLLDRLETITCKNNNGSARTPMTYKDRRSTVFEGTDSVRAGRFAIEMVIPRSISYSTDAARAVFYAVDKQHERECHGQSLQIYLDGTDQAASADSVGPDASIYVGNPDNSYGTAVGADVVFGAVVSDSTGIDVTGNIVGHDMQLIVDGNVAEAICLNSYFKYDFGSYRSGTVNYPLTGLSKGRHTVQFRVWDVCDNLTTRTLAFTVADGGNNSFEVGVTTNPARVQTNFMVTGLSEDADAPVGVEVFDTAGRLVWESQAQTMGGYATLDWSLTSTSGSRLQPGIYIYRAKQGNRTTDSKKIIIVKQ